MPFPARRVVVQNDANGKTVVAADEIVPATPVGENLGISGSEMWSSDMMPVDNSAASGEQQKEGVVKRYHDFNYVGNGQGNAFRITQLEPGCKKICHRTETLDYDIVLTGELDLELDGQETVHLKAGDVAIVRGATHGWANRGSVPATIVFVMIDAIAVEAGGQTLHTIYPA